MSDFICEYCDSVYMSFRSYFDHLNYKHLKPALAELESSRAENEALNKDKVIGLKEYIAIKDQFHLAQSVIEVAREAAKEDPPDPITYRQWYAVRDAIEAYDNGNNKSQI